MNRKLRVVVGGYLGLLPAGGVTWDYLQYPLGFSEMGCETYYVEDTRLWPVYQQAGSDVSDCSATIAHLSEVMNSFGMADCWAYRDEASGECFGMTSHRIREVCRSADVFVNVSCSTFMREEYRRVPIRILIDSDPMFTQIQCETQTALTAGESGLRDMLDAHSHHFTFGENVNGPGCLMPDCGVSWQPTRQPVCLRHWGDFEPEGSKRPQFTTIMNWSAAPDLSFRGRQWGQKNVEFMQLIDLPRQVPNISLAMAVGQTTGAKFPADKAREHGWTVLDPREVAHDWRRYRRFIHESSGEFSVAKQTYVQARTGWFSCRSACYLAAGKPVVTQDTGWTDYLPHHRGLIGFRDPEEAAEALTEVAANYRDHAVRARQIAEEHFDSRHVLGQLLQSAGV